MVIVDGILVNEAIFREQFVCDLSKCKGGCCVEGDAGAPLTNEEAENLHLAYDKIKDLIPEDHREKLMEEGFFTYDRIFGLVTPTMESGICAYAFHDKNGIVKCALDQTYREGKSTIPKPVSCHLFPIREKKGNGGFLSLNYEPIIPGLCESACTLGQSLKVPVYRFLKEAIIRRFGEDFYASIEKVGERYAETGKFN